MCEGNIFAVPDFCPLNISSVLCVYRFKPLQKVDGMSDSLCGSSQHCSSTPEQSVAAQSQHHQQYIGMNRSQLGSTNLQMLQIHWEELESELDNLL